ncbi:MAG TPA: diol dehydratase small subunit [Anaerolineales bacterium]|nr:diol dehydratase small subunit [Anaerolineales bacterium]
MRTKPPQYPLRDNASETLTAVSGRRLADVTTESARAGELTMADFQISADTLRVQAEVARQAGYPQLALNLIRAAELTAVPNAEVLRMYNTLRPGRATHAELVALADLLEQRYQAPECARMVNEAAAIYQTRDLLQK